MENRVIEKDFGDLALNMGPQHPSTHGVFRLKLYLEGEKINKIESFLGYLHRGVEKLTEKLDYDQIAPVLERDDYLSPTSNSLGFVNAVEKICEIEVTRKASYIRVLVAELQRISSHLVALGTYGLGPRHGSYFRRVQANSASRTTEIHRKSPEKTSENY